MTNLLSSRTFTNSDGEVVPYAGEEVQWRVSVYAICIRDGHVLLAKNQNEDLYDVPGGGVEIGETLEEALQREAHEEAGVRLQIGNIKGVVNDWFKHANGKFYQAIQIFYEAEVAEELGVRTDPDMTWSAWVPVDAVPTKFPVPSAVMKVLGR